jgi:hypothetical protein
MEMKIAKAHEELSSAVRENALLVDPGGVSRRSSTRQNCVDNPQNLLPDFRLIVISWMNAQPKQRLVFCREKKRGIPGQAGRPPPSVAHTIDECARREIFT